MITVEQVKAAKWTTLFLHGAGFWQHRHVCTVFPRLAIIDEGPRNRRSKVARTRRWLVDGRSFATLEAAVDALNKEAP